MTTFERTGESGGEITERRGTPLSEGVDWLVSLLSVVTGVVLLYGGLALYWAVDRATVARWVADGYVGSDVLTNAELVEVTYALVRDGGIGVAVVGGLFVAAGAWFHVGESRSRRRFEETGTATPNAVGNAVLGAFVTLLTSFLVLSPLLGGGVTGYRTRRGGGNGLGAAALSGLLASLPVAALLGVVAAAVRVGSPRLVPVVGFVLVAAVATAVGLSALGGYAGVALASRPR